MSLILGFLFVWDMPRISRGISSLATSRLAPVYNEVAPMLLVFGQLFGKALQVQVRGARAARGWWRWWGRRRDGCNGCRWRHGGQLT